MTAIEPTQVDPRDEAQLAAVFHRRAEQLAQRGRPSPRPSSNRGGGSGGGAAGVPSVVLRIAEERFAIELASVKQVFPRGEITPVPAAPEALLGVANLNGSPRSVFDLGRLLNVRSATTNAAYIVLLNVQHKWMGLAVESIEDIRRLETDKLMPVEEAAAGTRGHPAHGSAGCRVADSPGAGSLANGFTKGITEDRIAVLDGELLLQRTLPKPEARAREQKTLAGAPS